MKKQRTKLLIIIVAVMAAVILVVKLKEPVSTLLQTPPATPSATPLAQEDDGRNMYLMEEFGVACGFKYTVKDVYLTRKYGGWVAEDFSEMNEYYQLHLPTEEDVIDDNGDFLPGYFYLVVTLEIQNLASEFQELSVTQNSIQNKFLKVINSSLRMSPFGNLLLLIPCRKKTLTSTNTGRKPWEMLNPIQTNQIEAAGGILTPANQLRLP